MNGDGTSRPGSFLAEVAEHDARDRVADIYADIRAVLGIPVVNLVYRSLAVEPARLEAVWVALRPNLTSRAAADAALELVEAARPRPHKTQAGTVGAAGIGKENLTLARATLEVYSRGNSTNLLAMHALLDGCPGTGDAGGASDSASPRAILPMARLDTLAPETLSLLRTISASLVGDQEPLLVPSLLRHFAGSPPLLEFAWRTLQPELPRIAAAAETVLDLAQRHAARLPFSVSPLRAPDERATARRFGAAMSTLLVAGETLARHF